MSRRDEVKYKRLSNCSDDFEAHRPLLASANGRTGAEGIALAERRSAFYGPIRGAGLSDRLELTNLRVRGENAALSSRPAPKSDEQPACFERDIKPGETLTSISVQYSCPIALLKQVNHLVADQEFYGLRVIRVPTKKYGLLAELLALENEENRQRLMATASGRASKKAEPLTATEMSSIVGPVGNTEPTRGMAASIARTTEPGSPSTCSDPSDFECDPLLNKSLGVGCSAELQHCADRSGSSSSSSPLSHNAANPFSDFLKAKDKELKNIAARIECRLAASDSNDTLMLMRTSPTFPLQIQRSRPNTGGFSIGARWGIASVVAFVLIIAVIIVVVLLKHFHSASLS